MLSLSFAVVTYLLPVLDSIIADIISFHARQVITDDKHGFIKGRSAMTNLSVFATYVLNSLESGCEVDCVCTDLLRRLTG